MTTTTDTNVWTNNHPFEEDESRTKFNPHMIRWSSRCKVCGSIGFTRTTTSAGTIWTHKPLSPAYRRYMAEQYADAS